MDGILDISHENGKELLTMQGKTYLTFYIIWNSANYIILEVI